MTDSQDIAELRSRVGFLEQEVDGEKRVSRHVLWKVTGNEALLLDVWAELGEVKKEITALRNNLTLLRADLPGIIISQAIRSNLREHRDR